MNPIKKMSKYNDQMEAVMKKSGLFWTLTLFLLCFLAAYQAKSLVTYNYTTLIFLDYEQLNPIVRNSIKESRVHKYPEEGDKAIAPLRNTMALLFSRPDNDGLLRKLLPSLISELQSLGVFEKVIHDLIRSAEHELKNKSLNPKVRTTAILRLNNILLTIRPLTLKNIELAKEVCRIADSNTKIPSVVQQNSQLTTMFNSTKPSDLAKKIMLWYAKKKGKDVKGVKGLQGKKLQSQKKSKHKTKGCPYSKRA